MKAFDLARKHGSPKHAVGRPDSAGSMSPRRSGGVSLRVRREDQEAFGRADARCRGLARAAVKTMVGPAAQRDAVAHLQAELCLSKLRACYIVSADRKTIRYRSCRPPDTELRGKVSARANDRRRFGCRRLFVLLRQQSERSGLNRIFRLYREEGLNVRKRGLAAAPSARERRSWWRPD